MSQLWLIIWRFQPLHKWHLLLIETSLRENPATLILIGSINKDDTENPYDYNIRKEFLQTELSWENISIGWLIDVPGDAEWIDQILSFIPEQVQNIHLYCGDKKHDSAVQSLLKVQDILPYTLTIHEIPRSIIPISATEIRRWISEKQYKKLSQYVGEKTLQKIKSYW